MAALRFYWVVGASGAVLMALEILSSRLLSPHFGSSVYVWGSIIGVFLAALSVGYAAGGRLADRHPSMGALGRVVVLTGLCQAVLLLVGEGLAERVGALTGGRPAGTLLAAGVLFGPPTVLLGMVSPFAVRLAARDLTHLGDTAGRLYALSTGGSLLGTLACTFLFIPYLDLGQILGLLLLLTALTALVALAGELRAQVPAGVLAVALVAMAVPSLWGVSPARGKGTVHRRITPYQTLQVRDSGGVRYLVSDNTVHAAVRLDDGSPALTYTQVVPAAFLLNPEIESVLALGLGAGNVGAYLRSALPALSIDYVEIDPAVPEVARRFLSFEEGPDVRVHVRDARRFMAETNRRWDFILCDTYIGLSVPFHLTTREFFAVARERLTPGGVLAVNLAAGVSHPFSRAIYRTLSESFASTYAFQAPAVANVLVFATRENLQLSGEDFLERARALAREMPFAMPLPEVAGRLLEVQLEPGEVPLLTDDYAPVERLIAASSDLPEPIDPQPPTDE